MSEKTYRRGIARVSLDLLGSLLYLPEGHKVLDVRGGEQLYFEILIEGPSCPESALGQNTPRVQVIITHERGEPEPSHKFTASIKEMKPPSGIEPDWLRDARAETAPRGDA